jgi:mono/diheme cytochrome c family protein
MNEKKNFETEINFKELPKSPSRLFGWIFPYYLILFVLIGVFFVKHMDNPGLNNVPANYTDSLDVNVNVELKKGGIMPAIDLSIISNANSELKAKGKELYNTNCSSCHGADGKGNGVAAAALNPSPRNFHNLEGWKNGVSFNDLYKTLQEGIADGAMVAYEFIPVEDRISIIHYVRTFTEYPPTTEEEVAALDKTYDLSKGVISPSTIPLEMAKEKIANEAAFDEPFFNEVISKINANTNKDVIELFNKYTSNKEKVISIFKRDFANSNVSEFVNRVISFPSESGFKSSITRLSKEELNNLFDLLSKSVG